MPKRDIIVVGGSGVGLKPFKYLPTVSPPDLPAAVFIVLHMRRSHSFLPEI